MMKRETLTFPGEMNIFLPFYILVRERKRFHKNYNIKRYQYFKYGRKYKLK